MNSTESKIINISLDNLTDFNFKEVLDSTSCNIWELRSTSFLNEEEELAISIIKKLKKTKSLSMPVTFNKHIIYESLPDIVMASSFWDIKNILNCIEYATSNLLPCTLVVFSDSNENIRKAFFEKAIKAKKHFPNVKLQIRCDWTPIDELLSFIKDNGFENEWVVDLPICIAEKYNLNVEDTIISEVYNKDTLLQPYNFSNKIKNHCKFSLCKKCLSLANCWGCIKGNTTIRNEINPLSINKTYKNPQDIFKDEIYKISIIETTLKPPYLDNIDLPLSIRTHKFSRNLEFKGPNNIEIFDLEEPLLFKSSNTPNIFQEDSRGLLSVSFPFIGRDLIEKNIGIAEKSKKEYFISRNGFFVLTDIAFSPYWNDDIQKFLESVVLESSVNIIKKYGNPKKVIRRERDVLYDGYRVIAGEWRFIPNQGITEDLIFYCGNIEREYETLLIPSKRVNVNKGITELIPNLSKEKFMSELKYNLMEVTKCIK